MNACRDRALMARDVGRHALLEPILLRRRHRTPYFSDLLVPQLYGARASRFRTAPVVPADQEPATSLHDLSTCPNIAAPFIRHRQAAGIDGRCGGRRTRVRLGPLKRNCLRSTLAGLFADIASAQPSSAGLLALKSSLAGVAVVTCLVDPRLRSGPAMPMAECFVQPSG